MMQEFTKLLHRLADSGLEFVICEEAVMTDHLRLFDQKNPSVVLPDGRYCVKLPERMYRLMADCDLVTTKLEVANVDDGQLPRCVTFTVNPKELSGLTGGVLCGIYTATDIYVLRKLRRIEWYLKLLCKGPHSHAFLH